LWLHRWEYLFFKSSIIPQYLILSIDLAQL
jgi:hypothetical protein